MKGARELASRLSAISKVFPKIAERWSDKTVALAKSRVHVRSGSTKRSIRRRSVTRTRAVVSAAFGARYLEHGARAHLIEPQRKRVLRFQDAGNTIFSKKVQKPRQTPHPFLLVSGRDAIRKGGLADVVVSEWNAAA